MICHIDNKNHMFLSRNQPYSRTQNLNVTTKNEVTKKFHLILFALAVMVLLVYYVSVTIICILIIVT